MFKMRRAQAEEPRQDTFADNQDLEINDHDFTAQAVPASPRPDGLKSKVPPALSPIRRQTAAPDGATIRQQFEAVRRYAAEPGAAFAHQPTPVIAAEPSTLLIGRDISFKGEISDCQSLVVEGTVVANAKCHAVQIQESGVYEGEIEAETIEVCGHIEGHIRVRGRLTIRSVGRANGNITYGELDISAGGQLSGDIQHEPVPEETPKNEPAAISEPAAPFQPVVAAADTAPLDLSDPPFPQDLPYPTDAGPQVPTPAPDAVEPSLTSDAAPPQADPDPEPDPGPFAVGAAGDRL